MPTPERVTLHNGKTYNLKMINTESWLTEAVRGQEGC